jgi:hypothetical protein
MSHEASHDNSHNRGIAPYVWGLNFDANPAEVKAHIERGRCSMRTSVRQVGAQLQLTRMPITDSVQRHRTHRGSVK